MLHEDDREFLVKAAIMGHEEVRLSQLALTRASNPEVRKFAEKLISDHEAANAKVMTLASSRGLMLTGLPPTSMSSSARTRIGSSMADDTTKSTSTPDSTAAGSSTGRSGGMGTTPAGTTSGAGSTSAAGSTYAANTAAANDEVAEQINEALEKIRDKETELAEKTGSDFDEAYLEAMKEGHEDTIDLFRDASRRTDADPEISAFASETLSKLQEHEHRVEQLADLIDA